MRRTRSAAFVFTAVLAIGAGTYAGASSSPPLPGRLVPTFGVDFSPKQMPRNKYTPVSAKLLGQITTADGTHPPALREALVDVDKHLKVNVKDLPVCRAAQLEGLDTKAALRICGDAAVGSGIGYFQIAFPEQKPPIVDPPITVFNGGERAGKVKLLIHTITRVPKPAPIVTVATIERKGAGLHSVVRIPVVASGAASLIDFKFNLGRTYTHKGKKVGLLEARCPDGKFVVGVPKLLFRNEAEVPNVPAATILKGALVVPCTPKG